MKVLFVSFVCALLVVGTISVPIEPEDIDLTDAGVSDLEDKPRARKSIDVRTLSDSYKNFLKFFSLN